jgi:hypothetical protein
MVWRKEFLTLIYRDLPMEHLDLSKKLSSGGAGKIIGHGFAQIHCPEKAC